MGNAIEMKEQIQEFTNYLYHEKHTAQNTAVSYERDLNKLESYLARNGIAQMDKVTQGNLSLYIDDLEKQGFKSSTVSRNIASVKAFFSFLQQKGYVSEDVADSLKAPKVEKKVPTILTVEETEKLLAQPRTDTQKGLRDRAMLELLYATGIRVSELISLKMDEIHLEERYLTCKDTRKERQVPFGEKAHDAVQEYLANGREALVKGQDVDCLFTNCSGQAMSRQGFWKLLKAYGQKAGISVELTPHTLRHSFAAHMLQNGAELKAIQELLGHIDTIPKRETKEEHMKRLCEIYGKTHPRG